MNWFLMCDKDETRVITKQMKKNINYLDNIFEDDI